jgi:hypothetical protein
LISQPFRTAQIGLICRRLDAGYLGSAVRQFSGGVGCGAPTGPVQTPRIIAISVLPATASRNILLVQVPAASCG